MFALSCHYRRQAPAIVALLVFGLAAAAGAAEPNTGLQGRAWVLKACAPAFTAIKGELTLSLQNGQLSGNGGINTISGGYQLDGKTLAIGDLASTKMAGDPELMMQEQTYLGMLEKATGFAVGPFRLVLTGAAGEFLLLFEPAGAGNAFRPIIHAPASGEKVGPNVTVAGRTGSGKAGVIAITTEVYVDGARRGSVPGHRNQSTAAGKYWLRVAIPRLLREDGAKVFYVIRVAELDVRRQPRGPEAFVVVHPKS